ncbi:hypothetical protein L195_g024345, partial [Trifolium pratense]
IECDASGKGVELFLCIVADMFAYEKELFNCFSNTNMAIRLLIATISQQGETLLCLHPDSGIPSFCNSAFCANFGAIFCTVSATFCSISYKLSCFHFYSLVSSYYGNFISQRLNQQQLKLHQNTALQDYNIYHSGLVCSIVQTTGETIDLTWEWNSLKEKNNRKSVACDFGEKTATGDTDARPCFIGWSATNLVMEIMDLLGVIRQVKNVFCLGFVKVKPNFKKPGREPDSQTWN